MEIIPNGLNINFTKEVDNVNECASTIIIPSNHIKAAYLY